MFQTQKKKKIITLESLFKLKETYFPNGEVCLDQDWDLGPCPEISDSVPDTEFEAKTEIGTEDKWWIWSKTR